MVEQAKYAQANAEQELKHSKQTVTINTFYYLKTTFFFTVARSTSS
jgi:hypothetical protein